MSRSNDRDHPEYGYGVDAPDLDVNRKAQALQEEIVAEAWGLFETKASQEVQEQLKAVPHLRRVVEAGIHLGYSAALERVMQEEARIVPQHKAMVRDLFDILSAARSANKRVVATRAIERVLVRYR